MRHFLLGLGLAAAMATSAPAQTSDIEAVIGAQLEAFKADDFAQAFAFASPSIQELFGDPGNFGAMVRGGYPMVWRPGAVEFIELREANGRWYQRLAITDARGTVHTLVYEMIRVKDNWRINGVRLLESSAVAA